MFACNPGFSVAIQIGEYTVVPSENIIGAADQVVLFAIEAIIESDTALIRAELLV
jgi:hypothetical protein